MTTKMATVSVEQLSARAACRGAARLSSAAARPRAVRRAAGAAQAAFTTKRSEEVRRAARARAAAASHSRLGACALPAAHASSGASRPRRPGAVRAWRRALRGARTAGLPRPARPPRSRR
jgi:hypothetical protein